MDRQIVYVGAVPLDSIQLQQSRNTMVALGYFAKMTMGDLAACVDGFACTPGSGLSVVLAAGSMTMPSVIDSNPYGALPADGDPLLKIGINTAPIVLALPSTGTSIISAAFVESGSGSAAVAYYNVANPTQTLIGPQGNGQPQATVLQQRVSMVVSTAAAVPAGYIPLWQVTVPTAATTVTQSMIAPVPGAPFVTVKLPNVAPLASPGFTGSPTAPTPPTGDASGLLATTGFVAAATTRNRAAWGTGGSYGWICPAGVSTVLIRAWAAGGTGGSASSGWPGGGGGGGGYMEVLVGVTSGTSYAVQIGSGSGSTATGFGSLILIGGGANGQGGQNSAPGTGGGPGTPLINTSSSIATVGVSPGQAGYQIGSVNVGGAGGCSFGVQGAFASVGTASGSQGVWPGGGGAGGAGGAGGRGADGLLIIEWTG